MPSYVSLVNWTELGIKNFPDTVRRAEEFSRWVTGSGGKVRELLWTVGEYDVVHVSEFASDEKASAAFLRLASAGNVRSPDAAGLHRRRDEGNHRPDRRPDGTRQLGLTGIGPARSSAVGHDG